jgi:hypothetical protein
VGAWVYGFRQARCLSLELPSQDGELYRCCWPSRREVFCRP